MYLIHWQFHEREKYIILLHAAKLFLSRVRLVPVENSLPRSDHAVIVLVGPVHLLLLVVAVELVGQDGAGALDLNKNCSIFFFFY